MKGFLKGKFATVVIILATVVLAGIAIFTAVRLYQLRQQPVAPNVPSSIPRAAEVTPAPVACTLSFTLAVETASPTPTATPSGTPTETPSGTPTATPTGTPGPTSTPNACNGTCGSNFNCASDLVCYNGFCRNPSCTANANCLCSGTPGPTGTPVPPTLPSSGVDWPTVVGAGVGVLTILGSLLLAI